MSASRFKVVLETLAGVSEQDQQIAVTRVSIVRQELDKIAELRRLSGDNPLPIVAVDEPLWVEERGTSGDIRVEAGLLLRVPGLQP